MTGAILGYAAIASTLIGAGVTAYGQAQAGKTQAAIANFNARQQEIETRTQFAAMQAQAAIQEREAEANYRLRQAEANARFMNARKIEQDALDDDERLRANMRRQGEDFERMKGEQRAAFAASGIAETVGTPLDLIAETAAQIQIERQDQLYQGELNRRSLFQEATMERLGGHFALAGATLDRNSALAGSDLKRASAQAMARSGKAAAEVTRLTGAAKASAANISAASSLFSGVGSAFGSYNNLNPKVPTTYATS